MTVQLGNLLTRDSETNITGRLLENVSGVQAVTIGNRTFVYAASVTDDAISIFEIDANGDLTLIGSVSDEPQLWISDALHSDFVFAEHVCSEA